MKNSDLNNYRELSQEQMSSIIGGDSIAYRIGQALRYGFILLTQGDVYAKADLSVNCMKNEA